MKPASAPDHILSANIRHFYFDIGWFGILAGSSMAFLSVYAAHLGASGIQLGLITAGPAAVNLLISIPAGHWLARQPSAEATYASSVWHRVAYLALIPLPWLLEPVAQTWSLILLVVVMSIPGTVLAIAFNAMFADLILPERRDHVVSRRNAILAVTVTLTSILCGQLLDRIAFPMNYQIVFGIGALGAAMSSYHLRQLRPSQSEPRRGIGRPLDDLGRPGVFRLIDALRPAPGLRFLTRARGRSLLRLDLLSGPFGPFLLAFLFFYVAQFTAIPLFPILWVRELGLSDWEISVGTALFHGAMLMVSLGLRPLAALSRNSLEAGRSYRSRPLLILGALGFALFPMLNGLANGAPLYWISTIIGGGVWAVLNVSMVNQLMERAPEDDRPAHMALHNLALNVGILAGSLMGPVLGDWIGVREALLVAAGLRLIAGLLLLRWES